MLNDAFSNKRLSAEIYEEKIHNLITMGMNVTLLSRSNTNPIDNFTLGGKVVSMMHRTCRHAP